MPYRGSQEKNGANMVSAKSLPYPFLLLSPLKYPTVYLQFGHIVPILDRILLLQLGQLISSDIYIPNFLLHYIHKFFNQQKFKE